MITVWLIIYNLGDILYNCQLFLEIRKDKVIPIPEDCVIDPARLRGLSNAEFISAFETLQNTVIAMYDDAMKDPESWGFPLEPFADDGSTCGPLEVKYHRIFDVLEALITEGEIIGQSLHVNIKDYKNKIKKHKKNKLMLEKIAQFGFVVEEDKNADVYVIQYERDPNVFPVLQSYVSAALEYGGNKTVIGCLFYRLVEDKQRQKYDTIFLAMTDTFTEEARQMCMALYDKAQECGSTYVSYFNDCHHQIDFKKFMYLMFHYTTKEVHTRMILHKLVTPEHIHVLYELPAHLQESFKVSTCHFCSGMKSPDTKCNMRICYNWHGEEKRGCAYRSFQFRNLTIDDLPYLYRVYQEEFMKN